MSIENTAERFTPVQLENGEKRFIDQEKSYLKLYLDAPEIKFMYVRLTNRPAETYGDGDIPIITFRDDLIAQFGGIAVGLNDVDFSDKSGLETANERFARNDEADITGGKGVRLLVEPTVDDKTRSEYEQYKAMLADKGLEPIQATVEIEIDEAESRVLGEYRKDVDRKIAAIALDPKLDIYNTNFRDEDVPVLPGDLVTADEA